MTFQRTPATEQYAFTGFFLPIPVKFSLGGDQGLDIFALGYPLTEEVKVAAR